MYPKQRTWPNDALSPVDSMSKHMILAIAELPAVLDGLRKILPMGLVHEVTGRPEDQVPVLLRGWVRVPDRDVMALLLEEFDLPPGCELAADAEDLEGLAGPSDGSVLRLAVLGQSLSSKHVVRGGR